MKTGKEAIKTDYKRCFQPIKRQSFMSGVGGRKIAARNSEFSSKFFPERKTGGENKR